MVSVDAARQRIRALDEDILALVAERVAVARRLARDKAEAGHPTVDFAQERRVLDRGRALAAEVGLDAAVADGVLGVLIDAAVTAQEDERIRLHAGGAGATAVVVGGAGRMGGWLVRFLTAQGHDVFVLDPALPDEIESARMRLVDADMVIVAAPPSTIADIYVDWLDDPPKGVICDVASIKSPLTDGIRALREAGASVASIHPMFGPDTRVLRDVDLVVCDTGDDEATERVARLFAPTAARVLQVPLDEHDAWMADVLALAHATALAFATALPDQPCPARSKTLGALSDLAWGVVHESPEVYYEIQARNPHSAGAVARLADAVAGLTVAVAGGQEAFGAFMADGRTRLARQREVPA